MLTGKPVRVVFSREEEFFYDTFHPAAVIKLRSGLGAAGNIVMWDYAVYAAGERGRGAVLRHPEPPDHVGRRDGAEATRPATTRLRSGRGAARARTPTVFARESQMDVMAAKAGIDPVEFRLKNLKDARMIRVLNAAARSSGGCRRPAPSGRGVGCARAESTLAPTSR